MKDLLTRGYVVLDNFISPERAADLNAQFKELYRLYPNDFTHDKQCSKSYAIYDCWPFLELLCEKLPEISKILEEPVFPTYCYSRLYKHGEVLAKHTDRGACEVSITLHLGSDGVEWPIYFERLDNGEEVALNMKPGQAALYLGKQVKHWRNEYAGEDYSQVFLHYVRARGPYKQCYFDKVRV